MISAPDLCLNLSLERPGFRLDVDLKLPGQGVTVIFGPSGSGKTTLLRCVAGLERARGQVLVGGQTWQDSAKQTWVPTWSRDLGYVFQEASLFEHMDVQANLRFGLERVKKTGAKLALDAAVTLLGIDHLLGRSTHSLSGGERQRVAIARALATQPDILLLDEPLASLDIARRLEILPWLERMHRELRIPMLYVTHTMDELTRLADHVVLMDGGKVSVQGSIDQVLSDPVFAASVGGEAGSVLHGTIQRHDETFHLTCIDIHGSHLWVRHQPLDPGSPVRLRIHANDVSLTTMEPQHTSIQNILPGDIISIHPDSHPASCLVRLRHHDQIMIARITRKSVENLSLDVGKSVWMQVKSVALAKS